MALRSFSPIRWSLSTSASTGAARMSASSMALVSRLEKIMAPGGTTPRAAKASARSRPSGDRPQSGTGTLASIFTCGWVT
ncbi:hypothetical protein D3C72_1886700 [compost metagenome]